MASKSSKKTPPVDTAQAISEQVASKFPTLSQGRATLVAVVAIVVGGLAFAVYVGGWPWATGAKPSNPARTVTKSFSNDEGIEGSKVQTGDNSTVVIGSKGGIGIGTVEGPVTINQGAQKTKADLRITGLRLRNEKLVLSVLNDGPDTVKSIKGTLVADAAPPPSSSKLRATVKEVQPGRTIELETTARARVWYPIEIQVWSDENEDPIDENNEMAFDRYTANMIFIPDHSGKVSWSESELNAKRVP